MQTNSTDNKKIHIIIIIAAVLAIYGQTVFFDALAYDDEMYVFTNRFINGSEKSSFTDYFIPGIIRSDIYMPVTLLLFRLIYMTAGPSAQAFHAVSLLLYASSCALFYILSSKILACGRKGLLYPESHKAERYMLSPRLNGNIPALAAALIYACLPLHVEYVSWISATGYSLAASLFFASFIIFIDLYDGFNPAKFAVFALASVSAVLAQPAAAVLPLALGAWTICFRKGRIMQAASMASVPAAAAIACAILTRMAIGAGRDGIGFTAAEKAAGFGRYIFNFLFPCDLMMSYTDLKGPAISPLYIIFALLAVLSILFIIRKSTLGTFCSMLFFLSFLPYLNILYVIEYLVQDRYMIFTSCAWAIGSVLIFTALATGLKNIRIMKAASAGLIIFYTVCSLLYIPVWKNSESLFSYEYAKNPNDRQTAASYGFLLKDKGKYEEAVKIADRLIEDFPDFVRGYGLKVICLEETGNYNEIYRECDKAKKKHPDFFYIHMLEARADYASGRYKEAYENMKKFMKSALNAKKLQVDTYTAASMLFKTSYMECRNSDMESCIRWMVKDNPEEAEEICKNGDDREFETYLSSHIPSPSTFCISRILHVKRLKRKYGEKAGAVLQKNTIMMKQAEGMLKEGRFNDAEKIWMEASESDPFMTEPLCRLAYMALQKNEPERAEKYISAALHSDPSSKAAKELKEALEAWQNRK